MAATMMVIVMIDYLCVQNTGASGFTKLLTYRGKS